MFLSFIRTFISFDPLLEHKRTRFDPLLEHKVKKYPLLEHKGYLKIKTILY